MPWPNCIQVAPDCALLFILAQESGAPLRSVVAA